MFILRFLKNIVKFLIKEIVGSIIFLILLTILIVSIFTKLGESFEKNEPLRSNSFLIVSFNNGLKDYRNNGFDVFEKNKELTLYQTLESINYAKNDSNITGIVLNLDNSNLSFSQIEEINKSLVNFKKSNKPILAYGNSFNKNNYLIGIYADKIYMNPAASTNFSLDGFNINIPYYKELTGKIGVEFQVLHIGNYKSYGENFVKSEMSQEFKNQYFSLLQGRKNYFVNEISSKRKIELAKFENDFLNGKYLYFNSKKAKENKFIDKLLNYDEFLKENSIENTVELGEYYSYIDKKFENDNIALITLEGDISTFEGENNINPFKTAELLEIAKNDVSIKGIVIRINSPGGSALASEIINQKVREVKKVKPIYVSISQTAASGGYYIASAGDKIFANKNSITGSIGVVSMFFNLKGLYEKLGLKYESIELGKTPSSFNFSKKVSDEELKELETEMTDIYNEFKLRVSQGRNIKYEKVEDIAQGKVYDGVEAKKIGLVDEIGDINDTIEALAKNLKLNKFSVNEIKIEDDKFDKLFKFTNYLKSNNISKNLDNIENKYKTLEELNSTPSLYFPYKIN
ncbi:MAG: signal peptide peptidase SppA [Fusobacteriaceae bacterium]|nr:signal peptide peptidase SppA [Fusobacteriaceae bacterium]